MRYIHKYDNKLDLDKDVSTSEYKKPWCSYVKRRKREEKYFVSYNKPEQGIIAPSGLWIDDFPDGTVEGCTCTDLSPYSVPYTTDFVECFYDGYSSFDEYLDDYILDISNMSTYWEFVGTAEFDNVEYFMYEGNFVVGDGVSVYGLMPKIYTLDYLKKVSMYINHSSRFQPFDYILRTDDSILYSFEKATPELWDDFVLVKVEP